MKLKDIKNSLKKHIGLYQAISKDKRTPHSVRIFLCLAIGYFFLPFDIIPDFIPVLGYLDDAVIIPFPIYVALKFIPPPLYQEHYQRVFKHDGI